ncbi:MAG: CHRD domain-containing protein [Sporichthyaceae bacterium]
MNRFQPFVAATVLACTAAIVPTAAHAGDGPVGIVFRATLAGSEVPGGGDPKGSGTAILKLVPATNEVCWDIAWTGLAGSVTGIHLHHGGSGETGPHAVDMVNGAALPGASGSHDGCQTLGKGGGHSMNMQLFNAHTEPGGGSTLDAIVADPEHYYVQLHTTAYEKGAVRGQLG